MRSLSLKVPCDLHACRFLQSWLFRSACAARALVAAVRSVSSCLPVCVRARCSHRILCRPFSVLWSHLISVLFSRPIFRLSSRPIFRLVFAPNFPPYLRAHFSHCLLAFSQCRFPRPISCAVPPRFAPVPPAGGPFRPGQDGRRQEALRAHAQLDAHRDRARHVLRH
eukprot:4252211-Pleurochrysis_carterae.AAC.1